MAEEWEKIFTTSLYHQAEIVKARLKDENIHAIIVNKQDQAYQMFGEIEVYVPLEQAPDAIKIVDDEIRFQ